MREWLRRRRLGASRAAQSKKGSSNKAEKIVLLPQPKAGGVRDWRSHARKAIGAAAPMGKAGVLWAREVEDDTAFGFNC